MDKEQFERRLTGAIARKGTIYKPKDVHEYFSGVPKGDYVLLERDLFYQLLYSTRQEGQVIQWKYGGTPPWPSILKDEYELWEPHLYKEEYEED